MIRDKEYRGIIVGTAWNDNKAAFSQLTDFARAGENSDNIVGIKYVISGCENYTSNKKTYSVKDGCFFLVNPEQSFEVLLESKEPTMGLCFNLDKKLLSDVWHNYSASDNELLDQRHSDLSDFSFPEIVYGHDDHLSQFISSLKHRVDPLTGKLKTEKEELFFDLAKHLLIAQSLIRKQIALIKANKKTTREELFKRMNEAKSIIDDAILQPVEISELAASVALSEFHFFRIFKQVYGITPHQYQLKQRLHRAKSQIKKGSLITDVAANNGFPDIYSFSKAFKKMFGVSPITLRS